MDLQTFVPFFETYGYAAVFGILLLCGFGLPVPEDISLVSGGIIAGLGFANVHFMVAVGLAGVLIGDSVMFNLGRHFGERFLAVGWVRRVLTPERFEGIRNWLFKYGRWLLFAARFMPGLRAGVFLTAGITRFVSYPVFILIDGSAAVISVPVWVYLGYFGASRKEWLMEWMSRSQLAFLAIMLVIVIVLVIVTMVKRRIKVFTEEIEDDGA
ncbi:MAG: DedA family protein [Spirochaetes bacterium]|nr:MAG: DedA family protein [Spirochaetota bacterium]